MAKSLQKSKCILAVAPFPIFKHSIILFPLYVCWFFQFILVLGDPDFSGVNCQVILLYSLRKSMENSSQE